MSKLFNKLVTMNNSYLRSTIAYSVYAVYPDGTKTLLGSNINFDKTFGGCNNSLNQYCIIDGSLYYINTNKTLSRVGTLSNWQKVSSYTYSGTNYAIESGNLYSLSSTTATLVSSTGDWTFCSSTEGSGQANGIRNGYPYRINGVSGYTTALSSRGSVSNLMSVNGEPNHTWMCMGITSDGALYQNSAWSYSSLVRYGTSNGYTRIGGVIGGTDYTKLFGLVLGNGKIYAVNYNSSTWVPQHYQIGTSTDWLDITGWYRGDGTNYFGTGIRSDTKLYYINAYNSEPALINGVTGWSVLSGCSSSLPCSSVGINNNSLYTISYSGVTTTVDTTKKWVKIYGSSATNFPCIAICEQ